MASKNKFIQGNLRVSDNIYEDGLSLSSKYARDSSVVHKGKDETITGNKTFNGGITMNPATAKIVANKNDNIKPERNQIWSSPVPKYLWHDILSFGMKGTPTVETSTDGITWNSTDNYLFTKTLFINKEASKVEIINDSTQNIRWTWNHNEFAYCEAAWLAVGVCHDSNPATVETTVECSTDGTTWRTLHISSENTNQAPRWFLLDHTQWQGANWCRITMKRTSAVGTIRKISNIKILTSRWGDQGKGSEYEYPYQWDHNLSIYPKADKSQSLGLSNYRWKEIWTDYIQTTNQKAVAIIPDTNTTSFIGDTSRKWDSIVGKNIYGDTLYEGNISLINKYAEQYYLNLNLNTTGTGVFACPFLKITFNKTWQNSKLEITVDDIDSKKILGKYWLRGRSRDSISSIEYEIKNIYKLGGNNFSIFATQNNNVLTVYIKTTTNYIQPRIWISKFQDTTTVLDTTVGSWTSSIPEATFTETFVLDESYISVVPSAESKTKFRISNKGYPGDNNTVWYYKLCSLPKDNDGNYASAIISGRIGGWLSSNMSYVNALIWNRQETGIALIDIAGTASNSSNIWNICDIVIYDESDETATVYLKCKQYFTFDLDLELYQTTANITYDGTYTTSPTGTLAAQASTSTKRLELINGELKVNGESLILSKNAVQKQSYAHTYAAKVYGFDNQGTQNVWNVGMTAAGYTIPYRLENGQLSVGTPTANEHATTKEYVDTNYIPKKSINNAYQAIVDNSGAAFTVTAGLSNNTGQTILKIAPSGTATINDKQIATTDDIPSYGNATTTTSGLMSASDKTTLTALTCKSESKDIALGLTSLIGGQTVNPITANITDRSFFSKIIDLMRAGQVVTGFYLQLGNYYTFLKLFFANLEGGYENLSFEITDANDNSCVSYGINYDASNYIITFNKRDASIADALVDDNGTTYYYNSFALSSHNQASNTINAMTNYSKPTSTSAIKATDSLNTAIGKLEKALDGKGTSNLTLGTTATTAAAGDHTHSAATTSAAGLMSAADKTKLDTISNNYVKEYNTGKNGMPGTIINNGSSIYIHSGNDSINVIGEGDEHGVGISVGDNNFVNFYQDRTEMIDAPVKIKQIQAPTASNGTTYGLGTSGQVLKSNGTSVYWANDSTTTYPTFTRGSTDFSPAYTLTAKDAGFIHTWWRCSSNLYASCNFGNVIAVSATNLFPMQKYSPGTNTSNQTTAYQKSVSSGSRSYSNNSFNAFQIPQRGDMVIDQYGCIGVIESDPTTVVSTYSVRLVWKSIKDWSCLEKGTQITLADGTYKNIEDVRQGESIMGWDFEKNEPCEAIALFADAAQADEKTTYLVLDNGEILSMTDGHTLYSKNLERYIPINDLREGDILMGKDGEDVEVVSIHWNIHTFGIRQFYHVVSSNNTYFANNTLNAIHPVDKYNWLQNRSSEVVPDEILAIFEQDKGEFDCFDFTIKNKEFLALTSKHQSTLKKHRNKIGDLKNYLTNTDYVAIKMFEGLEVDETILDIRKEKRKEINALEKEIEKIEKEYNNLLVQYSDLGEDMLLSDNARRSKYFKVACKNDNEHLDLFKKYYPLKDEAYILKEIEEGKANRPITEVIEEEENE